MACFRLPRPWRNRVDSSTQSKITDEIFNAVFGNVNTVTEDNTPIKTIRRVPKLNPLSLRLINSQDSVLGSQNCDENVTMNMERLFPPRSMREASYHARKNNDLEVDDLNENTESILDISRPDTATLQTLGLRVHSPVLGGFVFPYPPTHHPKELEPKPEIRQLRTNLYGHLVNCEPNINALGPNMHGDEEYNVIPLPSTEISLLSLDEDHGGPTKNRSEVLDPNEYGQGVFDCDVNDTLPEPSISPVSHSSSSSLYTVTDGVNYGCTAPAETQHWRLTSSALMAYNSMRGPFLEAGRDIYSWAERCQDLNLLRAVTDENEGAYDDILADISSLYYNEQPSPGDPPGRKDVFYLPRAPYEHIHSPVTLPPCHYSKAGLQLPGGSSAAQDDTQAIGCEYLGADSEDWGYPDQRDYHTGRIPLSEREMQRGNAHNTPLEDDFIVSDNEGHPEDGRISPCTFRLFTQSCRRRRDTCQIIERALQHYQPADVRLKTIEPFGLEHQAPRYPGQYYPFSSGSGYAHEDEDEQGISTCHMTKIVSIEYWVFTGYWPKNSDEVSCV